MKQLLRDLTAWAVSRLPSGIITDRRFFDLYQSRGWHATPVHFYQPIPDTRKLSGKLWNSQSELVGLDVRLQEQLELFGQLVEFISEFHQLPNGPPARPTEYTRSRGFGGIDGAILYSMIRRFRPRRIIEIGSGISTLLSIVALKKNAEQHRTQCGTITAIDPFPRDFLADSLAGIGELKSERAEDIALSQFELLGENDLLFIDSSHTVRTGGDVVYELLEVVPRLRKGVIVHFHDIFLPRDYPKEWVLEKHVFWAEQYLLQAFLAYNNSFEILWSGGCMQANFPDQLSAIFPYFDKSIQQSGSFWIRRIA